MAYAETLQVGLTSSRYENEAVEVYGYMMEVSKRYQHAILQVEQDAKKGFEKSHSWQVNKRLVDLY